MTLFTQDHRVCRSTRLMNAPTDITCTYRFSSQRREERKVRWRRRYEALQDTREISTKHEHNPDGNLKKEVNFLVAQAQKEENLCQMYYLGWSFISLIVFWWAFGYLEQTILILTSSGGLSVRLSPPTLSHGPMAMGYICKWRIVFDWFWPLVHITAVVMYPSLPLVRSCLSWYRVWYWNSLGRLRGLCALQSCWESGLYRMWV